MASALPGSSSTTRFGDPPSTYTSMHHDTLTGRLPPTPPKEHEIRFHDKQLPRIPSPTNEARSTRLERRRSATPVSFVGGPDTVSRGNRNSKGFGPKLPVKLSPMMSMADMRSGMRMDEDGDTPGEASDAFEDAVSKTPSRRSSLQKDEELTIANVGLGIDGESSEDISSSTTNGANADFKPKMSARLSVFRSVDPTMYSGEPSPPMQVPSHSRQATAEKVQPPVVEEEQERAAEKLKGNTDVAALEQERTVSPNMTSPSPTHSRQVTLETAPSLVARPSRDADASESSGQQATTEEPSLASQSEEGALSLSSLRAGLQSHSRQATAEVVPVISPPTPVIDRERSVSPTKQIPRDLPSPPPPPAISRLQAERPSPNPTGGLMRTASTRMAGFLGRMGTMRKPGRSPPAPRQESRFGAERRNTAQSIASIASIGGESLATISDSNESGDGARPSLQDQFQSLRQQEETGLMDMEGQLDEQEQSRPPNARTVSDTGSVDTRQKTTGELAPRTQRALSTPSLLRSPPMNPSLPPGTASGLSAGPADEPRPVDWDLWQAVVYEGPAAVQRSSGEELRQAIASGIPAAIRGVVWQVLAESKNAELENVYRTLRARGNAPDGEGLSPEPTRPESLSRTGSQNNINEAAEQDEQASEVVSSRASVHSERSTPATSNLASPPMSVKGDEQELKLKLLAEKQKREAAALLKLEKAIKRDLGSRTSFSKFTQAAGLQDGLFGVCKAYALFDEGVGYAQGINFIAMPLLFNMTEEEAFTLLVRLMSKYDLRSMFTGDMSGLHLRLYQFERLLEDYEPALYCHLRRRNVGPQLYATQWFLTLFAYRFPLQLVLRVYDLVLSEGLTAILKFGLVLMQHNRDTLLAMKDMGQLTTFLKEKVFDVYIDKSPSASSLLDSGFFGSVTGGADKELYRADEMVRDACSVQITDATLAQYTAEWEESQRQIHERETELENLRTTNTALTTKVRELEERTQLQDNEHVNIAGELVRVKVENDTLMDENEGLKMKVEELQKLVDSLPGDVENKLKEEMDRILQRNSEVQSENRVLKEEMEEMEHELVNAKMQRAQTQQDHDALIQKFANIQSMLSEK